MSRLYASPLRVYLCLAVLALAGIFSGLKLPISLFPNSAKPVVGVWVPYGSSTPDEFLNSYGRNFEEQLRGISGDQLQVESFQAHYERDGADYEIQFQWGNSPATAQKEVQLVTNSFASRLPDEIRDSVNVWTQKENAGFLAVSFFSAKRSMNELYELLEPVLMPPLSRVQDAGETELFNPSRREIRVELIPEKMASLQLLPREVERAISGALTGFGGGSVTVGIQQLGIQVARPVNTLEDLGKVVVASRGGKSVHLSDIARIDFGLKSKSARSYKTSGAPSLILFSTPKPDGNVKRMSEEILAIVEKTLPSLPKDIEYRILVDPSEFIRASINNVLHEVAIGALLAVVILFLFIGSFRNTVTAAIEIPLSMVMAFILMRMSGMNLNLISLGGLALSAGMNVDASVVVMENIFRHFEGVSGKLSFEERLKIITQAVREVQFPVIASTIASLVVFLPLAFTSDLSYAILGDLAKTVVFSHGFSAFVALILVPTVRLQLMSPKNAAHTDDSHPTSPIERQISWVERRYGELLDRFIASGRKKLLAYTGLIALLAVLAVAVLPRLPKEIIGRPDTDWITLSINTRGNTLIKQMESQTEEIENQLLSQFGSEIQYTFTQVNGPNRSGIMSRLKNKKRMRDVWKAMEERFANTPFLRFRVAPWNPAELPIPDPPQLRIALRGGTIQERADATEDLSTLFEEKQLLPRIWTDPKVGRTESILLRTSPEQWAALRAQDGGILPSDIADIARVATTGRRAGNMMVAGRDTEIYLRYPEGAVATPEALGALPLGVGPRIIPLKALAQVKVEAIPPAIYREDGRELFLIEGKQNESSEGKGEKAFLEKAQQLVKEWAPRHPQVTAYFEEAERDLTEALHQLAIAVALSVGLIFLTLLIQFGDFVSAALVLVSVPLGFIGVLVSLFVFRSSLSLNSVLGVILLNGIAVANSIILVDFLKRLVDQGLRPREAAIEAACKRLRPILITSLTTILGMLPIALGMGEGGRILQPLGIAVSGGLWVSMALTLFVVPALQVTYLEWKLRPARPRLISAPTSRAGLAGLWARIVSLWSLGLLITWSVSAPANAAELKFEEALTKILERSTAVGLSEKQLEQTEAGNTSTRLHFLPSLSVTGRQSTKEVGAGTLTDRDSRLSIEAAASLNLLRFGADLAAVAAARAEEESLRQTIQSTRLDAESDAVAALLQEIRRTQELEILERLEKMELDSHRIAQERYQRGLLPLQEVEKVSIDLDNARARLSDGQVRESEARAKVVALLGHAEIRREWPWIERLRTASFDALLASQAFDPARLPSVLAARARVESEESRLSRQYRLLMPSVDASLVYGVYSPKNQDSYPAWTGILSVTLPLFDRLSTFSSAKAQARSRESAELRLEQNLREAREKWESARQGFQLALSSARAREKTLLTSRKLYEDGIRRFQQGRLSTSELFVEQSRLSDTEFLAVASWSTAHLALTELCHALGKPVLSCLP